MAKKKKKFYETLTFWQISVVILIILIILILIPESKETSDTQTYSKEIINARVSTFLDESLPDSGGTQIHSSIDKGLVFEISTTVGNESALVYASKDGKYLFPGALDMTKTLPLTPSPTGSDERVAVSQDDDPSLGDDEAPIVIVEFSDYECPYCRQFALNTFPELKEKYIDTGIVKFVFRDLPASYHMNAQKAAEASECADEQGKFWEYHELLFENGDKLSTDKFTTFAVQIGLDIPRFTECLNSGKYANEVASDRAAGFAYGVTGAPSFYINGLPVAGALPFSSFKEIIDREMGYQ